MYKPLALALQSDQYSHSDLGDGTSVLTSLSDSKIISLNLLGTMIVTTLIKDNANAVEQRIESLIASVAEQHKISVSQSRSDINSFIIGLSGHLNTALDATHENS